MKKRVRIKDIAIKAGVSVGTVDRVLHERGHVAEDVRSKVTEIMQELGYERNILASALAFNKVIRIVALLPDYRMDPYWQHPYEGAKKAELSLKHYGAHVECRFFDLFDPVDFLKKAKEVLDSSPDGLLFPPLFKKEGIKLLDECKEKNIPTITINTFLEHPHVLAYIGQDSFQSGVLAARLLNFALRKGEPALILNLEKGVTNAAHILEKERGFRYYFANNGSKKINVVSRTFEDFDNKKMLHDFLSSFTQGPSQVGGIFVTNSRAYKVVDCLDQEELEKLVIVGFDPIEPNNQHLFGNKINFLINQNSVEQGYLGILALFKAIFLKQLPEKIQFLPLDIVVAENIQYYLRRQETIAAIH